MYKRTPKAQSKHLSQTTSPWDSFRSRLQEFSRSPSQNQLDEERLKLNLQSKVRTTFGELRRQKFEDQVLVDQFAVRKNLFRTLRERQVNQQCERVELALEESVRRRELLPQLFQFSSKYQYLLNRLQSLRIDVKETGRGFDLIQVKSVDEAQEELHLQRRRRKQLQQQLRVKEQEGVLVQSRLKQMQSVFEETMEKIVQKCQQNSLLRKQVNLLRALR